MIPLLHDFDGETVLVVGGGPVGARKARHFAREAEVLVLGHDFADADFGGTQRVRVRLDAAAVEDWLDRTEPALVVAATDDADLNGALERRARERGVLVNRADRSGDRDAGSVVVPATVRDGPVVAAVGTGGRSPALSRHLRQEIEPLLEDAGAMADLTASLREDLDDLSSEQRREALRAVIGSREVWKALDTTGSNPRAVALDVISDLTGDST